jgi:uncharacterized protein YtpQ (UPF0354 family)
MFNKSAILDNVKTRLGSPVVDLAITDEMISKQIDFAINKIIPYLNNMEVITVYGKTVKFEHKKVYAVVRVTSSHDDQSANVERALNQGFYVVNN